MRKEILATREQAERLGHAAQELNHETRVLLESLQGDVRLVAEGVTTVRDQLGRAILDHEQRIARLERLHLGGN